MKSLTIDLVRNAKHVFRNIELHSETPRKTGKSRRVYANVIIRTLFIFKLQKIY